MNTALHDGQRIGPFPRGRAECPFCGSVVIARCGRQRAHHWAHLGRVNCDTWKESETPWHRAWKSKYPIEYQEYIHEDSLGEKHIADVRTNHGFVIEFQHSHLDPKERETRERFYKSMVWVVDGTRLVKDYPRFRNGKVNLRKVQAGLYLLREPEKCFPADWINSPVPVIHDYRGIIADETIDIEREVLWCLLPGRAQDCAVVVAIKREDFVAWVLANHVIFKQTAQGILGTITVRMQIENMRKAYSLLGQRRQVRRHFRL